MDFTADDRANAVGIAVFFIMVIIAGLLFVLLDPAVSKIISTTESQAQTSGGVDQINLAAAFWNNILYAVLGIAALYLIARAVRESERGV